ncbi:ArsR/SmtB family transcription factor [Costertonia aggregata]|uniref:Helix-turn-helix transcriptional regulator n=1 Tax=Costertonia aggregata TaxID=343403 RepID=A0A7H9AMN5_9FLAO|nr:helix-turn-helix transcriptional regulator [Costertonia aggregata]QLG44698.1 helix-turn-helix transcriptional regulator [Costertonia aggregata]
MESNHFISVTSLLCEPSRAKILWNLLDGRAYTASELALTADLSASSVSNHLSKLLKGNIVKVDVQGRHRYFSFANAEVAYVVESLASLANKSSATTLDEPPKIGVRYCRTCYDHLAGYVGVKMTDTLVERGFLIPSENIYSVTETGWKWLSLLDISKVSFVESRRPLTRQCLDWSERRVHLAGHLGAVLLEKMLQKNWLKKVEFSREVIITSKGSKNLYNSLGVLLK